METTIAALAPPLAAHLPPAASVKVPQVEEMFSHRQLARQEMADREVARAFAETASRPPTTVSTSYDPVLKSVILTTYRSDTGSLVTQIPSREMLAFAHRTRELSNLLLNASL